MTVTCPTCHTDTHALMDSSKESYADLDVCVRCWELGLHWPDQRARRHCADCDKWLDGFDWHVVVDPDGGNTTLPVCREHYEARTSK